MNEPEKKMSECLPSLDLLEEAAPLAASEQLRADTSDSSSRVYFIISDYSLPFPSLILPSVLPSIRCSVAFMSEGSLQIVCLHPRGCLEQHKH